MDAQTQSNKINIFKGSDKSLKNFERYVSSIRVDILDELSDDDALDPEEMGNVANRFEYMAEANDIICKIMEEKYTVEAVQQSAVYHLRRLQATRYRLTAAYIRWKARNDDK